MFVRGNQVWIAGQEGLILHSADQGKTWRKQDSGTKVYLFSVFFINDDHGFAAPVCAFPPQDHAARLPGGSALFWSRRNVRRGRYRAQIQSG